MSYVVHLWQQPVPASLAQAEATLRSLRQQVRFEPDPGAGQLLAAIGASLPPGYAADDYWTETPEHDGSQVVSYLYDDGEVFSYVQQHQLASLNTRPEALHELALINLGRHADGKLRIFHHGAIHGVMLDQQFEASVLLLDAFWEGPAAQYTPHGAVAAVPSRGVLLFCDRHSAQGIAELRGHLAKGLAAGGIELSAELFARNARGDWAVLPDGAAA